MKILLILSFTIFFYSCQQSTENFDSKNEEILAVSINKDVDESNESIINDLSEIDDDTSYINDGSTIIESEYPENSIIINIEDLLFVFYDTEILKPYNLDSLSDSLSFMIGLGGITDQDFILKPINEISQIKVSQYFNSHAVFYGIEEQHINLRKWKTYQSPMVSLIQGEDNIYRSIEFPDNLHPYFPKYTKQELIDAIKEEGGEYWINEFNSYPTDTPDNELIDLTPSSTTFVVSYQKNKVNKRKALHIVFPTGC